jgi:Fur family transcriptional regulator, peroxide stress response regulator
LSGDGSGKVDAEARVQRVLTRVKERGCRMTPQRAAVVRTLVESTAHPSAEEVFQTLVVHYPMLSLATVYKTVTLLKEMGEVAELLVGDEAVHYDGRRPDDHPHLVCTRCGSIVDVPLGHVEMLVEEVASATGYTDVSQRLDFWGVCPRCQSGE